MDFYNQNKIIKINKINKSYWNSSPVKVISDLNNKLNYLQIIPNNILINYMENIIQSHKYKLNYKINDSNITSLQLCEFINKYYNDDNEYKFLYPIDTIQYFQTDSIVLTFYSKDKMIGLIIGKKSSLYINNIKFDTIEANFLTLHPKVRNKNLTPLIISILVKELIKNYSLSVAHYTINNPIQAPYYSLKYYYHRMINIPKLLDNDFLPNSNIQLDELIQIYNNFNNNYLPIQQIIYINKKNNNYNNTILSKLITLSDLIKLIYNNINKYSKSTYIIYQYKTLEQITQLFDSESFYHFIFIEQSTIFNFKIKNYICINKLETNIILSNNSYINGYIYMGFYLDPIDICIEKLSEFIFNHKLFDVITWSDFFNVSDSCIKFVKGTGFLKYYLYNIQITPISNEFNGLVTL